MKITKAKLKQIIKEELSEAMRGSEIAQLTPDISWPIGTDDIIDALVILSDKLFGHPNIEKGKFNEMKDINDILINFVGKTFISGVE